MSVKEMGRVFSSASRLRARDLLRDIGLGAWTRKMDYTEYGGACLLGVNGNVIIAHGRSRAKAIKNAILMAAEFVSQKLNEHLLSNVRNSGDLQALGRRRVVSNG